MSTITVTPSMSLQTVASGMVAGDTAIIKAGTYQGFNLLGRPGGNAAAPIQFLADPGVVLSGPASGAVASINIENCGAYWIVQGFDVRSGGTKAGIRIVQTHHSKILKNKVTNCNWNIFVGTLLDIAVEDNETFSPNGEHCLYCSNVHGFSLRRNKIYNGAKDSLHLNKLDGGAATYTMEGKVYQNVSESGIIEDNDIYGANLSGIDAEGTINCQFNRNSVHDNQKHGITLHNVDQANTPPCTGSTFGANKVYGNGMAAVQIQTGGNSANSFVGNWLLGQMNAYGSIALYGQPTGMVSARNVVSDRFSTNPSISGISLAQWQTSTRMDLDSVIGTLATPIPGGGTPPPTLLTKRIYLAAGQIKAARFIDGQTIEVDFDSGQQPIIWPKLDLTKAGLPVDVQDDTIVANHFQKKKP